MERGEVERRQDIIRVVAFLALVEGPRKNSKRLAQDVCDQAVGLLQEAGIEVPDRLQVYRPDPFQRVGELGEFVRAIMQEAGIGPDDYPATRREADDLAWSLGLL